MFMKDYAMALGVGMAVGFIFTFVRLPIPVPDKFSGIVGIIGVWIGYAVARRFF